MAINLQKGQRINLEKSSGTRLQTFCVGVNWGAISTTKRSFFGRTREEVEAVDLDASCVLLNSQAQVLDVVFFNKLQSEDGGIRHSGDDRTGDVGGDDGLDNEIISVQLTRLSSEVDQVIFFLNSFEGHDFAAVPFAAIRLYEGTPQKVNEIFATYDIASDPAYRGFVSMVMGKLYRKNGEWKFNAIGDATRDRDLRETVITISQKYA